MNNGFLNNEDDIGIDPTTLSVIESLDDPVPAAATGKKGKKTKSSPKENGRSSKSKKAKSPDFIKKLLFVVIIILALGLVGGGVYFYLHMANGGNTPGKKDYTPNNVVITVGDTLSENIMDYGDFSGVDLKTCKLDTSEVKTDTIGEYPYFILCGNTKYSATVIVLAEPVFNYSPVLAFTTTGKVPDAGSLISTQENYIVEFPDVDYLQERFKETGIHRVDIRLINEMGQSATVNGFVLVLETQYSDIMVCSSEPMTSGNKKYTVFDTIYFDSTQKSIATVKTYSYELTEDEVDSILENIDESGQITYDGKSGFALLDPVNNILQIDKELFSSIVEVKDVTTTSTSKEDLVKYYTNTKHYTCN